MLVLHIPLFLLQKFEDIDVSQLRCEKNKCYIIHSRFKIICGHWSAKQNEFSYATRIPLKWQLVGHINSKMYTTSIGNTPNFENCAFLFEIERNLFRSIWKKNIRYWYLIYMSHTSFYIPKCSKCDYFWNGDKGIIHKFRFVYKVKNL